ncbi:MAG: hypothetical protein ABJF23_12270 [Bryobacteraceae bacterium]
MRIDKIAAIALMFASSSMAQTVTGLAISSANDRLNEQLLQERRDNSKKMGQKQVVVSPGDRVIPQFVDGGSWKTSLFFVNLESHSVTFQVLFFNDDGRDLYVQILGQGSVRGLDVTLDAAGSIQFETLGSGANLTQGWALLSQSNNDSVGGMAIFRQSVAGRADQEAVVPIVSQYDNHFVLLFDNTSFTTAIAIANPTTEAVVIPVYIRNQAGQIIDQRTVRLGSYSHTAFTLPDTWVSTAGRRGAIEFLTSGFGVAALGLRFNGAAFTSFHVLENSNWAVPPPR